MKQEGFQKYNRVCKGITVFIILLGVFCFTGSIWRLIESVRDFGVSFAYGCLDAVNDVMRHLGIKGKIPLFTPTVTGLPTAPPWSFGVGFSPATTFPETWEEFVSKWDLYWTAWADSENFLNYLVYVLSLLLNVLSLFSTLAPWLFVVLPLVFKHYCKTINQADDVDSVALQKFKRFSDKTYRKIKKFLKEFFIYVRVRSGYWKAWLLIAFLYFNVYSILVELCAFYVYFNANLHFGEIYTQIYKLLMDLSTFFTFMPAQVLFIMGVIVYEYICRTLGYNRLYRNERRNTGFVNERGVVTIIWGEMGTGKTALITDMALTAEKKLRDQAFEIILECDMKFPYFPWINFERQLRQAIYFHVIYDIWSCKRWVKRQYKKWLKSECRQHLFDYDIERYPLTYDDKLKEVHIWDVLKDYACAYLVYTVQSSLIQSNYSIRVDGLMYDLENFPVWNMDFFKRDSRLLDSYSRHSHILDFDMLRLGKIMLANNPNRNAYGFGVYVVTELDKERKNAPNLQGVDRNAEECNQRNDLFDVLLMMSRHACVIANRVFVVILADLQRTGNLSAGVKELGELGYIDGKHDSEPVLPFFSLYYVVKLLGTWLTAPFRNIYTKYRVNRTDNTLPLYLYKGVTAKFEQFIERTENIFGSATLPLEMESGREDGRTRARKWYRMKKKIYARRYATDCQNAIFERRSVLNRMGVDDLREYLTDVASNEELVYQKSHMQVELVKCVA